MLPPVGHIHCYYLREGYKLGPCDVAGQVGSQGLSDGRGGAGALKLNACVLHINTMVVRPCGVGQWWKSSHHKRPGTFSVVCHLAINATNLLSGTVYSYIMHAGTHPQPNMATSKETSLYQLWQHNGSPSPTGSPESTQEMPTETRDWDIDLFIWTYNLLAKVSPS